ncbi:hypothetical protein Tco_0262889 [Tanacetum coccineum]
MTNTRSGMTHAAIEEMINQRVNAVLEAHQVNQNLELGNGNNNGNENGNGNGNDNGNGNGNDKGNGNGNDNEMVMEMEMVMETMEVTTITPCVFKSLTTSINILFIFSVVRVCL